MPTVAANLLSSGLIFNFEEVGPTTLFDRESKPVEAIYTDNVMPIKQGISSVAFKPQFSGQTDPIDCHNSIVYKFTTVLGQVLYLAITQVGIKVTSLTTSSWINSSITFVTPPEIPSTVANLQGTIYLYVQQSRKLYILVELPSGAIDFSQVTLSGIDLTEVLGICSSGTRLVLYTKDRIFWSSVTDPIDFIPSLSTGAGSSSALALKTGIISVIGNTDGFIIYTKENAVASKATNDFNFPFVFSDIPGAAGIANELQSGTQSNTGAHIVWTAQGFQQVSYEQAQYVFPEISEALLRCIITKYSGGAPYIFHAERLNTRVSFIENRYICISFGEYSLAYFTDAYVFDTLLQRWGKLTVRHIQFISYSPVIGKDFKDYSEINDTYPTYGSLNGMYAEVFATEPPIGLAIPGETLGIILPNLAMHSVVMEEYSNFIGSYTGLVAEPAKVIFGKIKLTHELGVNLEEVRTSKIFSGTVAAFVHDYTGQVNRKNFDYTLHPQQAGVFLGNTIGDSVSLEITGEFRLTQLELGLSSAGKVNLPIVDTYLQFLTVMVDSANVYTDATAVVDVPDVVFNSSVETSS